MLCHFHAAFAIIFAADFHFFAAVIATPRFFDIAIRHAR